MATWRARMLRKALDGCRVDRIPPTADQAATGEAAVEAAAKGISQLFLAHDLAVATALGGATDEAAKLLRETAASQAHTLGDEHPRTLRTRVSLGEALLLMCGGDGLAEALMADEATEMFATCLEVQRRVLGEAHRDTRKTTVLCAAHPRRALEPEVS